MTARFSSVEVLKDKLGGRIGPLLDRINVDVDAGGLVVAANVILDPAAEHGIVVECGLRQRQAACEAAIFERLGLPVPETANDNVAESAREPNVVALPVIDPRDWDGRPVPERAWFAPNIPMRTVTNLAGEGGSGKTGLALQLMAASALRLPWLGNDVMHGRSIYYGAEDEDAELHRRFARIVERVGKRLKDLDGVRVIPMADRDAVLAHPGTGPLQRSRMAMTEVFKSLVEELVSFAPKLLVVDPAADVFGGDEIKRDQVREFIGMLRAIAMNFDCAVLLLSHPSLTGIHSGTGTSGSTAWSNSVRSRLYLEIPKQDGQPHPCERVLKVMKANYGPTGQRCKLRWSDGVYVLDSGLDPAVETMLNSEADALYLDLLTTLNGQGQYLSPAPSVTYAPAVMAKQSKAKGFGKHSFAAAQQRLLDAGKVRIEEYGKPSRRQRRLVVASPNTATLH